MSIAMTSSFGRYRLVREIGRGGEAIVHLAEDTVLKRRVALKIFPRSVARDGERPVFRREVEVLSRLRHPGICTVHDAGIEDGSAFIAMSYVEGKMLADQAGLGESEAVRIGEDVAHIVEAAHAVAVVHGDLKPANIIVTPEGRCVVLDFGIARLLDDAAETPGSHRGLGTLAYLPPECLVGPPDVRADVYGLAALLFELVAGQPPHAAPTRAALLDLVQKKDPPLLRSLAPGASRDLEAVLAKALERDPARRYATMASFAADLSSLRRGEPASARPLGPAARTVLWTRRRPAAAGLIAFVLVFLAVASAVTVTKNRELGRQLEQAGIEARRADDALRAAQEHLVRFERLTDGRVIADLEARAASLVPPRSELSSALESWLAEARSLERRLEQHREELTRLRSRAAGPASRPTSSPAPTPRPTERLPGASVTRLARDLAALRARHARLIASSRPQSAEPHLRGHIERLEASLPQRIRWSYASDDDAWHDDMLSTLIADLERFADSDPRRGLMADVERRIEDVRTIEASLAANLDAWTRACRSIADRSECPRYGGLTIRPQPGLVPLRRDAASGFWEFLHVLSGAVPEETPEGALAMGPESGIVLVLIPGGVTRLGATRPGPGDPPDGPYLDPMALANEAPPADVTLDPFFVSKFEMTHPQWLRAGGADPGRRLRRSEVGLAVPVAGISWTEAMRTLSRIGLELPTEAQWEHAARAGTATPWWTGAKPSTLNGAAVFSAEAAGVVGRRRPNAFGLHDVAGNVAEWCRDVFAFRRNYASGAGEYPADDGDLRAFRGGGYTDEPSRLRSSHRMFADPSGSMLIAGVRPARRIER